MRNIISFTYIAAALFSGSINGEELAQPVSEAPYDVVISGGRIIDGSNNPWFHADVGVRDGRIAAVGDLSGAIANEYVDAANKIVAPGFIDLHSHADDNSGKEDGLRSSDIRRRQAVNIVTQGVTTVVVNPDGFGEVGLSIAQQRNELENGGIGVNVALMVPHNAVRQAVLKGDHKRLATADEIAKMRKLVREGMEFGAFGLTSGLEYVPGRWSNADELVSLMEEVAPFDGVHISHMRSETSGPMWWVPSQHKPNPPQLLDAVKEVIEVARRSNTRGVSSHMKVRGVNFWGQSDNVIALVEAARRDGVEVYGDQYPYNSSGSDGAIVFVPSWAIGGEDSKDIPTALNQTLSAPAKREVLFNDIDYAIAFRGGAENIVVFDYPEKSYIGRSLQDLASERGLSPVEMVIAIQLEGYTDRPGGARLRSFSLQEKDIENLMRQSWVATSSDGGVSLPEDGPSVHARYYGTYPRKLAHYARERSAITLEHAIRASTSLPAQILGLRDRGLVKAGNVADIIIFDPDEVLDTATFTDPHQYATGISHVWVNGEAVISGGKPTLALVGEVLHSGKE